MTTPLLGSRQPIAAAPMAGGPSTVALARAVASAGGFPFLAAGYASVEALAAQIDAVRSLGPFGVNLFVPSTDPVDLAAFAAFVDDVRPEAEVYGIDLDRTPVVDDDRWEAKIALLIARPVPVVSLTFGLPDRSAIAALQGVGTVVLSSVTGPREAELARDAGVDGLIVQGIGAGGHSATFDPATDPADLPLESLVRAVRRAVALPVIAAGGIDGRESARRALGAGAIAVAVGTLLLRTDEAGTSPTHAQSLADPAFTETVMTRAFTGRPARALRNGFIDRHGAAEFSAYPAVHHLTRALRRAAADAGDADRLHLWAGTGWRRASTGPAADVIRALAEGP